MQEVLISWLNIFYISITNTFLGTYIIAMLYKISIFNFHLFKVFLEIAQYFTIANKTKY